MNKKKLKTIALSFLLLCGFNGNAQDKWPVTLNLQECLQYALQNSYEIHKSKFDAGESEAAHNEAKSGLLPQISGSASMTNNIKLPAMLMPGDFFGMPGEYIGVEMGAKYNAVAGIDLEQVIFDAGLFTGIKMSKNARELASLKEKMSQEELIYHIGNTFYDIMYSQNFLKNNIKTLTIMDSIYRKMELQVAQNITREIDLNRMKVNISNMKVEIQKTHALLSQQMNYLKVLMGMPLEYDFRLSGNMELSPMEHVSFSNTANNLSEKTELRILHNEKTTTELGIKQLKQTYIPTLSFFASTGYNFENEKLTLSDSKFWSNGTAFGVRLSVPVFDGRTKHHKIRQSQFQLRKIEEDIKQQQQTLQSDLQNARRQLQISFQSAGAQQENMGVAEKSYKQGVMLYEGGLYSITDLLDTEKSFREAQSAYVYELSNYHKSILELKKSEGTLNTLLNQ
ncbi:MAG: TolC family protein [Dysgonamonadaceae bacterium]|jgi:outer membrane protein TolC|nr:TolC family protein [Dysgonamonadaceae bacterium]